VRDAGPSDRGNLSVKPCNRAPERGSVVLLLRQPGPGVRRAGAAKWGYLLLWSAMVCDTTAVPGGNR
jgi:hypothetical protein